MGFTEGTIMAHRGKHKLGDPGTTLIAVDSATVDFTTSGVANHTLTGSVRIASAAGQQNKVTATAAGLRVPATRTARVVTATGTITGADSFIVVQNGATNITLTFAGVFDANHLISLSRAAGSTGSITLTPAAGTTIQAIVGTVGANTTLPAHSAAGLGVRNAFVLVGAIWYRTG